MTSFKSSTIVSVLPIVLASLTFLVNEVFSRSQLGVFVSLFIVLFFMVLCIKRVDNAIFAFFIVSVLVDEFPRDILLSYTGYVFNTVKTVYVGPISLYFVMTVFLLLSLLVRKVSIRVYIFFAVFIFISLLATFYSFLVGVSNSSIFLSNAKIIIYTLVGTASASFLISKFGVSSTLKNMMLSVLLVGIAAAYRVPLNLVHDTFDSAMFVFDLGVEPLYLVAGLIFFSQFRPLYVLGFVTTSRGEMSILFAAIVAVFVSRFNKFVNLKNWVFLIIISFLFVYLVKAYLPFLLDFLLWKMSEIEIFGGQSSGSSVVRQYEFINIFCLLSQDPISFLLGRGLVATYEFSCFPLPEYISLDEKSFSEDQLMSGSFYAVHNTVTAVLLRFGFLGLLVLFAVTCLFMLKLLKASFPIYKKLGVGVLLTSSLYYFHSQPAAQFVFAFFVYSAFKMQRNLFEN